MSSGQQTGASRPQYRRLALWSALPLLGVLLAGVLSSAFAQTGASASDAIPIGSDGRFTATTAAQQSTWFRFAYAGESQVATITVTYTPADAGRTDFFVYSGPPDSPRQEPSTPTRTNNSLALDVSDPSPRDLFIQVVNNNDRAVSYVGTITPSGALQALPSGTATPTPGPVANSAQGAITVGADGGILGSVGPRRAVWYRFWYGNPGADAVVGTTFAPNADSADLNIYTGPDPASLTQQTGAAARSGETLSRRVNLASTQWVYVTLANNGDTTPLAYSGNVSPSFAPPVTPTPAPTATALPVPTATPQTPPSVPRDERYFVETGYRIDNDQLWGYFQARGRIETFGFPVSRTFTFLGCQVQVFQRQVAQLCAGRGPALVNLLDPEIFPYTRVNGSVFPGPDEGLKNATPRVFDPNYATAILDFVRANAPDSFANQPVQFGATFFNTVSPEQAGTDDPGILGLLALEVWGAPISRPQADPTNANFIYQRFQRGIMHFTAGQGTRGILLADYLKQILLGSERAGANLPGDLREQAQGSRYFAQYCPGAERWLCRPAELPGTDLTFAFERG